MSSDRSYSMRGNGIYSPAFVSGLFDRMSRTYGVINYISSFGFSEIWRRQCVRRIDWSEYARDHLTLDLMSGMGECWHLIRDRSATRIIGVDFSGEMVKKSLRQAERNSLAGVTVLQEDILDNSLGSERADVIVSSFGLKTFDDVQLQALAAEVARLLRPGGTFSFVEISVPKNFLLRPLYMFYLQKVIPVIGKYFANDAYSYKYLGIYTANFENAERFVGYLSDARLNAAFQSYFFGCATGVIGTKPLS
ncbi:class I SAM-dependent methyltransferase [Lewinella sp. IMCC34191]|uniref:class I SAM-dependent methyltransferase n=1 Tax=Lewinella sp. IMCC34191 TaxID=2259172 RepID=UPI001300699F|nr:class I SAM-dependent methyltransferase [Lewinella sp. IMCC34191]